MNNRQDLDRSPDKVKELIIEALKHYDIGNLKSLEEIIKNEGNFLVKFKTKKGVYVLKSYSRNQGKHDGIKQALSFAVGIFNLDHIPIPLCVTKKGFPYVEIGEELISIDRFIENSHMPMDWNESEMVEVAKMLGRLHKGTQTFSISQNDLSSRSNSKSINRLFGEGDSDLNLYKILMEKENKNEVETFIFEIIFPFLRKEVDWLRKRSQKGYRRNKRIHLLHGDFQPNQILINDYGIANLIDYESMRMGHNAEDLARGIFHFSDFDIEKEEMNVASIELFLKTYKEYFGEPLECNGEEILTILRQETITIMGYILRSFLFGKGDSEGIERRGRVLINVFYKRLKWYRDNEDRFISLFD